MIVYILGGALCLVLLAVVALLTIHTRGAPVILGLLAWAAFAAGWAPIGWTFAVLDALLLAGGLCVFTWALLSGDSIY